MILVYCLVSGAAQPEHFGITDCAHLSEQKIRPPDFQKRSHRFLQTAHWGNVVSKQAREQ